MTEYISVPLDTDPDTLAEEAYDFLRIQWPDWEPSDGNFEAWLIRAFAQIASETRDVASAVPDTIFRWFGASVLNFPPVDAAPASVNSTWTVKDDAGYTIPANTVVAIPATGDESIAFAVAVDVTVPPGSTATATGEVLLTAAEPGEAGSGLSGTPELVDALEFVNTIALVGSTTGGVDAEADDDYLDRLTRELQLLTPRPILPRDFAVLARRITGIARSAAIDGYNPADSSYDNERMVSIAVVDENGDAVSSGIKTQVDDLLQGLREVNFDVHVIDPTYTSIDVDFAVKIPDDPSWVGETLSPADIEQRVIDALTAYLSPGNWGGEQGAGMWTNRTKVYYLEVAQVINNVPGVDRIDTVGGNYALTINVHGASPARADIALTGAAPLPQPGDITGAAS